MDAKRPVVVIGGGTGTHTILRGLKRYADQLDITAVVNMSDSGGSTGRLRDELGLLPVGDARMALAALADDNGQSELLLRELFLYRFHNGNGLKGHNLGNLLLSAMSDLLGSEAAAIAAASNILRVSGRVLPVTADNVQLTALYDDGLIVEGEHLIDEPSKDRAGHRIHKLGLRPAAKVNPEAAKTLREAELIILGPGDLYSSLLANCVVDGVPEAAQASKGRLIFVTNLMERFGQTEGMSVSDCVREVSRYLGREPDAVLVNNASLPPAALRHYEDDGGTKPVVDDLEGNEAFKIIRTDLVSLEERKQSEADAVARSLIRHDPEKLATAVVGLLAEL